MKRIYKNSVLSIFFLSLITGFAFAQSNCKWAKGAGGTDDEWGKGVVTDANNNAYFIGNFYSNTFKISNITLQNYNYNVDFFIAKYDSCGTLLWAKSFGNYGDDVIRDIGIDADNNLYITGYFVSDTLTFGNYKVVNNGWKNIFAAKFNSNGEFSWAKSFGGTSSDVAFGIGVSDDGHFSFCGQFESSSLNIGTNTLTHTNYRDMYVAHFDSAGNALWANKATGDYDDYAYDVAIDKSGNSVVTGYFSSSVITFDTSSFNLIGYEDAYIAKYSSTGALLWVKTFGGSDYDNSNGIAIDNQNNIYITGEYYSPSLDFGNSTLSLGNAYSSAFTAKFDSLGNNKWAQGSSANNLYTMGIRIDVDKQNNVYSIGNFCAKQVDFGPISLLNAAGSAIDTASYNLYYDVFVTKYNSNGVLQWAKQAGNFDDEYGYDISINKSNEVVVVGEFTSDTLYFGNTALVNKQYLKSDVFISNAIVYNNAISPNICMVTTDSLSKNNIVIWDKAQYPQAKEYVVYREVSTNNYKPLAHIPADSLSEFVDTVKILYHPNTGNPNAGTYRYKLLVIDTAGLESNLGPYQNTIFVLDNGNGQFNWNSYEIENSPNPVNSYILMRDDSNTGNWHSINSVSGTQNIIVDPDYNTYKNIANWRVETQWNINCESTYRLGNQNSINARYVKSVSNIRSNRQSNIGYADNQNLNIKISPNPSTGIFKLNTDVVEPFYYRVKNCIGQEILSGTINTTETLLDLSMFNAGIYFIEVSNSTNSGVLKIVKY